MWGVLLAAGGVLTWRSFPGNEPDVAPTWSMDATTASAGAVGQMFSDVQEVDRPSSPLLRMEWPEHPEAKEYRILFQVDGESIAQPLPISSPVLLYDLESNILGLPDRFDWAVAAVLPDGSELVSPWKHHSTN